MTSHLLWAQTDEIPERISPKCIFPIWLEAKEHCLEVAEAMPGELYDYQPTEVSKTFCEQMVHIGHTIELLTKRYVQGMKVKPNPPDASTLTKKEIIQHLKKGFDYTTQVIRTIEQDQLDETCTMYHSGNVVSRAFALFYVQDHMTNHRGQSQSLFTNEYH